MMLIDICYIKIKKINAEYRSLMDKLREKEIEKLKIELEILNIEQELDKLEDKIIKDVNPNTPPILTI